MGAFDYFKTIILGQLFWAFAITLLVSALPASQLVVINPFTVAVSTNMDDITAQLETAVGNQTSLPLLDIGALVYYSGNFLLSLMVNFVTAVPAIFTLLIEGLAFLIPVDAFFLLKIKTFAWLVITSAYILSILALIMNIRSGGSSIA